MQAITDTSLVLSLRLATAAPSHCAGCAAAMGLAKANEKQSDAVMASYAGINRIRFNGRQWAAANSALIALSTSLTGSRARWCWVMLGS